MTDWKNQYHPSANGAVQMIPHKSDREAARLIREAYAELFDSKDAA